MGLTYTVWMKIGIVAGLFAWLFYTPCLRRLWQKTNPFTGEPNWGHAIVIPVVGLYYLYLNRDELLGAKVKPLLGLNFTSTRLISSVVTLGLGAAGYVAIPMVPGLGSLAEYGQAAATAVAALGVFALVLDWGLGTLIFGLLTFGYGIFPGQNDWVKDFGMVVTLFGVVPDPLPNLRAAVAGAGLQQDRAAAATAGGPCRGRGAATDRCRGKLPGHQDCHG
jgi:hypothetical protein